jgi:hypothetical protein
MGLQPLREVFFKLTHSPAIRPEPFAEHQPALRDQSKSVATPGRSAFDSRPNSPLKARTGRGV